MPVHVTIGLLTAEAHDVKALSRDDPPNRLTNPRDHGLKGEVLVESEVPSYLLAVLSGRNQDVAVERRVSIQERDRRVIFTHNVMGIVRVACEHLADKATAIQPITDRLEVNGSPIVWWSVLA
jgi:hypothetical protein